MDTLTLQRTLLTGAILSLVLGIIILGSLRYNARLWLQDYPKPIQDKVPPLTPGEKRGRIFVAVLVMGVLLAGVIYQVLQIRNDPAAPVSFPAAYLQIFLLLAIFNLFDALVLDLIIIAWLQPKFVTLPGAEGMEYLYRDYRKHLSDFLKGIAFCVIASLPFAAIAVFA